MQKQLPMRTYNPLSVDELGKNAARALMGYPAVALPPEPPFPGAGVYTLHYTGSFNAYAGMREDEPIYVGARLTRQDGGSGGKKSGNQRGSCVKGWPSMQSP
ncbi:MAG: hypothetical protein M2R45_05036 [Verrucomicrobia subdivision 3 bacterium]|nr:hypothetical protein [Limisphaerales bacterium]MCS1412562.1 hypothetical protein [Limisphaerales bacterium]